jgi:hypothetical protein
MGTALHRSAAIGIAERMIKNRKQWSEKAVSESKTILTRRTALVAAGARQRPALSAPSRRSVSLAIAT